MENTTPISTRGVLLVLENIRNNAEVDYEAQNPTKMIGAERECNIELIDSRIHKEPEKGGLDQKTIVFYARNIGAIQKPQCTCLLSF